jgi:hypothetical protein
MARMAGGGARRRGREQKGAGPQKVNPYAYA